MLDPQAWVMDVSNDELNQKQVKPVRNRPFPRAKPEHDSGLWTSTWSPDIGSEWIEWCLSESWAVQDPWPVYVLEVDQRARVYEVNPLEDLIALCTRYPHTMDRYPDEIYVNWEAVSVDYDAVHLTDEGQWATRLTEPNLYGWDCESTLWFRWCFTSYRQVEFRSPERVLEN